MTENINRVIWGQLARSGHCFVSGPNVVHSAVDLWANTDSLDCMNYIISDALSDPKLMTLPATLTECGMHSH